MNKPLNKLFITLLFSIFLFSFDEIRSQEIIEIEPLFEYPVAPDELPTLSEKSDYLVAHFWDGFDFKNKEAVNQMALNDAFRVYTSPLRYANLNVANQGVDKLIEKISGNPTLLLQFTKAAEEALYGPRADFWIDEIYLKFLDAIIKNKKVPENRKNRLQQQARVLRASKVGSTAPSFSFENKKGEESKYFPMTTPTVIIFSDPENTDWRLLRLRLETNMLLSQAVDKGKINILFIIPTETDNWQESVSNYSDKWVLGKGKDILNSIDLRAMPSAYVIGSDGNLLMKNVSVESAVNVALSLLDDQSGS